MSGNIVDAIESLTVGFKLSFATKNANLSVLAGNLSCAQVLSGKLRAALETLTNALGELSAPKSILEVMTCIAEVETLRGSPHILITESDIKVPLQEAILRSIISSLPVTVKCPLLTDYGYLDEIEELVTGIGIPLMANDPDTKECTSNQHATLADHGRLVSAISSVNIGQDWAIAHNAKKEICKCVLAHARIQIAMRTVPSPDVAGTQSEHLEIASRAISDGLKVARFCGYGLYHIDLLLERARLHVLRGDADAALDDIDVALDNGVPANEETGQVDLHAANDAECGYAWAIPIGLQIRAEALLLRAAQRLGVGTITTKEQIVLIDECLKKLRQVDQELRHAVSGKNSHQYPLATIASMVSGRQEIALAALQRIPPQTDSGLKREVDSFLAFLSRNINGDNVSDRQPKFHKFLSDLQSAADQIQPWTSSHDPTITQIVQQQIDDAQQLLNQAFKLWQPLHDPDPERDDQNFKLDGKEYNYRAAETWRIIQQLEEGTLSRIFDPSIHAVDESADIDSENAAKPKDHRTALMNFLSELEVYEAAFSASDDEPTVDFLSVDHPLNRAATGLTHFYWAKKLPIKPRQDFRALIAASKTCEDFESIEKLISLLSEWAESESNRLNNMLNQRKATKISAFTVYEQKERSMSFHVFLSHNSKDKPDVKRLGESLKMRNLTVWLDEWELRPGLSWQDALEDIISNCKSAAVCVGENGIGPWEDPEMKALLRRFVAEKKTGNILPIIPVLLPGAPDDLKLPLFLEEFTWVDLRDGLKGDGLDRLVWGITGIKPNP
ncbi:MAG: toll/interleukin-1 receptor domain-containing protein [Planctomycetaceae bacterium]